MLRLGLSVLSNLSCLLLTKVETSVHGSQSLGGIGVESLTNWSVILSVQRRAS